jgi:hypothetical protein
MVPECVCTYGDQTADHLISDCAIHDEEREKLIAHTSKEEGWTVRMCDLVNKYLNQFAVLTNTIDFENPY